MRQVGLGRENRPFHMYKLRTLAADGVVRRPLLRRSDLDELPQILNVLRGEMRLGGPRPEEPHWALAYDALVPGYPERRQVKPGIVSPRRSQGSGAAPIRARDSKRAARQRWTWLTLRAAGSCGTPAACT
jgi:lipopolysaccharide/colanic/teichoic acid biosynthesis glycosyltransferase